MVGDDVAVLIDDETGAGLFALEHLLRHIRAAAPLVAEEAMEEIGIIVGAVGIFFLRLASAAASRAAGLGGVIGRDVDDARVELARQLGEFVAEFSRVRNHEWRGIRRVLIAGCVHAGVDQRPDHDPDRQRDQKQRGGYEFLLADFFVQLHGFICLFIPNRRHSQFTIWLRSMDVAPVRMVSRHTEGMWR